MAQHACGVAPGRRVARDGRQRVVVVDLAGGLAFQGEDTPVGALDDRLGETPLAGGHLGAHGEHVGRHDTGRLAVLASHGPEAHGAKRRHNAQVSPSLVGAARERLGRTAHALARLAVGLGQGHVPREGVDDHRLQRRSQSLRGIGRKGLQPTGQRDLRQADGMGQLPAHRRQRIGEPSHRNPLVIGQPRIDDLALNGPHAPVELLADRRGHREHLRGHAHIVPVLRPPAQFGQRRAPCRRLRLIHRRQLPFRF